ncbi:MAG: DinB family protein [Armatimonadota bacterium]
MLLHEVHHRAQAMAMLRQLGVEAQNLDYIQFVRRVREEPAQV